MQEFQNLFGINSLNVLISLKFQSIVEWEV